MKVLSLRADYGGCSFYRITEPARVVSEQFGVDVRVGIDLAIDATKNPYTREYTINEIQEDIDLLIIQRPLKRSLNALISQAGKQGIAVIVELDDDFENVHPKNPAWRKTHPQFSPLSNYEWLRKSASVADAVTVSTPRLLKYGQDGRSHVLRNNVPLSIFDVKPTPLSARGLGWTGSVSTHPEDLEEAHDGVYRVLRNSGEFNVVGDGIGVAGSLGISEAQVLSSGWVDLDLYYQTILDTLSVGIVPLQSNAFNHAKSFLKGLEMAALGIPFVASPTEEYQFLCDMGIGSIARTPSDWYSQTKNLIEYPIKRKNLGKKYSNIVRENLVYEDNAHSWLNVWEQAVSHRKRK